VDDRIYFPKAGFEDYLRDTSAPEGQAMAPMSPRGSSSRLLAPDISQRTLTTVWRILRARCANHHGLCNRRRPHTISNASRMKPADGPDTVDPIDEPTASGQENPSRESGEAEGERLSAIGQIVKDTSASGGRVEARPRNRVPGLA